MIPSPTQSRAFWAMVGWSLAWALVIAWDAYQPPCPARCAIGETVTCVEWAADGTCVEPACAAEGLRYQEAP